MAQRARVLHIVKTLDLGGAETNLYNLVSAFRGKGVEHHVAYSRGGEIERRFRRAGIGLYRYATAEYRIKDPASLLIVARLALYMLRHRINILHSHSFNGHIWGGLAAKLAGARVVEHVHDARYTDPVDYRRRRGEVTQFRHIRHFTWLADAVAVLTPSNRDYLMNQGYKAAAQIFEISNGIPLNTHDPVDRDRARAEFGLTDDAFVISTLSRMSPEKNLDLILRIAPRLLELIPQARLVIAGDGPLLGALRQQAKESGLRNLLFIGFCDRVDELLAASDLFLLPSLLELHSIAILEAMAQGVPVVVSRGVGCNDQFIEDGVNGLLLDPFSDAGWVEALVLLQSDQELRARIGRAGQATCRNRFNITSTMCRFEEVYASLLSR